jgi:hypothetical protein
VGEWLGGVPEGFSGSALRPGVSLIEIRFIFFIIVSGNNSRRGQTSGDVWGKIIEKRFYDVSDCATEVNHGRTRMNTDLT